MFLVNHYKIVIITYPFFFPKQILFFPLNKEDIVIYFKKKCSKEAAAASKKEAGVEAKHLILT